MIRPYADVFDDINDAEPILLIVYNQVVYFLGNDKPFHDFLLLKNYIVTEVVIRNTIEPPKQLIYYDTNFSRFDLTEKIVGTNVEKFSTCHIMVIETAKDFAEILLVNSYPTQHKSDLINGDR